MAASISLRSSIEAAVIDNLVEYSNEDEERGSNLYNDWRLIAQYAPILPEYISCEVLWATTGVWWSDLGEFHLVMTRPKITGAIAVVTNDPREWYAECGVHRGDYGGLTVQGGQGLSYCLKYKKNPSAITVTGGKLIGMLCRNGGEGTSSLITYRWSAVVNGMLAEYINKSTDYQAVVDLQMGTDGGVRLYMCKGNTHVAVSNDGVLYWSASLNDYGVSMSNLGRTLRDFLSNDTAGFAISFLIPVT